MEAPVQNIPEILNALVVRNRVTHQVLLGRVRVVIIVVWVRRGLAALCRRLNYILSHGF